MTARRLTVLASIGRHPVSGRPRVADLEARALTLALQQAGAQCDVVHAGPRALAQPVLRDMLGMGAGRLIVAEMAGECDPLAALAKALLADMPDIVLAGSRAEAGECGGALPFFLAEQLGIPIVTSAVAIAFVGAGANVTQALAAGKRRLLSVGFPFLATVDKSGPAPRLAAFAKTRRGEVRFIGAHCEHDARADWPVRPAAARPRRLIPPAPAGIDRLAVILGGPASSAPSDRRILTDLAPQDAADTILDFLRREGLAPAANPPPTAEASHARL